MFKFIKELFNKVGDLPPPTEKSLEQLIKEHNERVPLAYQKAIEEGKISEPVISFCDTVIENPARFKVVSRRNADNLLVDKLTGRKFEWCLHYIPQGYFRLNNDQFDPLRVVGEGIWEGQLLHTTQMVNCKLLISTEEKCYVYWRLIDVLSDYYKSRATRLGELKTERKNRSIVKERKELMGIYCKQS